MSVSRGSSLGRWVIIIICLHPFCCPFSRGRWGLWGLMLILLLLLLNVHVSEVDRWTRDRALGPEPSGVCRLRNEAAGVCRLRNEAGWDPNWNRTVLPHDHQPYPEKRDRPQDGQKGRRTRMCVPQWQFGVPAAHSCESQGLISIVFCSKMRKFRGPTEGVFQPYTNNST